MALISSLKHRPFTFIWSGQTISRLGDAIYQVALAWYVLQKTGSATVMATVFIFSFFPMLLFLLIGGVSGDRFPRLRLMIGSDILRGIVVGTIALLAFMNRLEIWHIYVASFLFGSVDAFFQPAYSATVPDVTPSQLLSSANSLTSLSKEIMNVIGPAIGAFIIFVGGTPFAFALDAVSFFISAALILPIVGIQLKKSIQHEKSTLLGDLKAGIHTFLSTPWLWINIALAAIFTITNGAPYYVSLPFLVKNNFHASVGTLGIIYAIFSLGSVIGALWYGHKTKLRRRGIFAYISWAIAGVGRIVFGLPIPIVGVFIAAFLSAALGSIADLIWTTTQQEVVPREKLGRVASIDLLGSWGMLPVGYAIIGIATQYYGASLVFITTGTITAIVCLLGLLHPAIRAMD